jgi:hypothetical protein
LWPFGVTLLPMGANTITKRKIARRKKTMTETEHIWGMHMLVDKRKLISKYS